MSSRLSIVNKQSLLLVFFLLLTGIRHSYCQSVIAETSSNFSVDQQDTPVTMDVLPNVYVYSQLTKSQKEAAEAYNRLRNAVYVTYPYARKAGILMNEMNEHLKTIAEKKSRKKYIKTKEKDLRKEFTKPLTNLSVYQGKVLMKLINRETGNNCYEIIKEYQGSIAAGFYQTVAFFFNTSLKQAYDPSKDDTLIEKFVMEVQKLYGYSEISKRIP